MANNDPNTAFIKAFAAAKTARASESHSSIIRAYDIIRSLVYHADDIKAALATHGLSELINLLQAIADGTSYTAMQHYRRLAFFDSSGSCVCCPPRALPHPLFERRAVGDNIDKGCIIDYCARHGGVSLNGAARYLGVAKTNRCSVCRRPGHNKNHCPGAGWI
jgi:hypothetical protein